MGSAEIRKEQGTHEGGGVFALLEIEPTGHRLQYLNHLIEAAGADRCVVLTSAEALESEEFFTHAEAVDAAHTIVLPSGVSRRAVVASAVAEAQAVGATRLVITEGDLYLLPLLQLMLRRPRLRLEIRLLLMRTAVIGGPEPLRPAMIVKPALVQALRLFPRIRVLFLTDALGVVERRRGYLGVRPVQDPVVRDADSSPGRPSWFPPADPTVTVVGVFGVISARKNLPLLVEAVRSTPGAALVVGGRFEPDVREFVDSDAVQELIAADKMTTVDRMLSPEEFSAALSTVDIVAVLHDNDSPSGILAEACIRQTPVIVPADGWLAQVARATGVGVAAQLNAPSVAAAIERCALDRDSYVAATRRQAFRINTTDFTERLLS